MRVGRDVVEVTDAEDRMEDGEKKKLRSDTTYNALVFGVTWPVSDTDFTTPSVHDQR